jgi:adenylate cyclase
MCAPILKYGEVIGIIYVEDPKPGKFGESDLVTLTTIANHISWNLDKVIRNENIKKEAVIRSNLERFLPFQLIDKITRESVSAGRINLKAEMVQAAILFSDIYGFTSLLEKLDPAEVIDLLTEYYKLMTDITFKYEGTLYKYDGSIIIAVFGAPVHNPNYAKNAVLAAIEMQEMQRQVKEQLEPKKKFDVKTGIAAGEIVTGSIKLPKSTEYTALGEAVIVANRLVALAESGNILVNKPINELVKADYITKFIGKMKAPKGDDKIEIYSVMSKIL